jgi:catechol 2,3-dioxygenase-like lactoylglutathione lyase family enzyme
MTRDFPGKRVLEWKAKQEPKTIELQEAVNMRKSTRSWLLFRGMLAILCGVIEAESPHLLVSHGIGAVETSDRRSAIMIQNVDNIGICVKDLKRAISFYEKLGFTKAYQNDRGATMVAGTAKLFVFQSRQPNAAPANRQFTLFDNPPGIDHISFAVEDVDRIYADARSKGIVFNGEPQDQDWGARVVTLRDPDGNNLYLLKWLQK